ncbi:MAG TPA: glycosyltransferase family 4 protein [Dongiaceae bacterium]|nr:glycosyltransferase family 4 protein [Dongiaceae bacterium]
MRIAVVNAHAPFVRGGAEYLANGLVSTLQDCGHEADLIRVPFRDDPQGLLDGLLVSRMLDLRTCALGDVDLIIALKFPVYLVPHANKIIWVIHQHRAVYDLWHNSLGGFSGRSDGALIRAAVRSADAQAYREAQSVYAISRTVSRRLTAFSQVHATPIFTPPEKAELFRAGLAEDFFYLPSRFTSIKRQDLIIRSLSRTRNPVRLVLAGPNSAGGYLRELEALVDELGLKHRVNFRGDISGEEKRNLYARCIGVVFCPIDEDYGYVTLEGMLSSKPIITTHDAGEPVEFVRHGETGLIVRPDPTSIAGAMDELWENRDRACAMGKAGRDFLASHDISWTNAVRTLLA